MLTTDLGNASMLTDLEMLWALWCILSKRCQSDGWPGLLLAGSGICPETYPEQTRRQGNRCEAGSRILQQLPVGRQETRPPGEQAPPTTCPG